MSATSIIESPQYLSLANNIGSFIEYWGFKQVHGKIWTLIFLSPEPVDANFLKQTLGISKALTSMSLKDLLHYNVILEVEKEKPGTQKYKINSDITQVILDIVRSRELTMLQEIHQDCKKLKERSSKANSGQISPTRLAELTNMVTTAQMLLNGMTGCSTVDFASFDQVMSVSE